MKSFVDYLFESASDKKYEFKIKVAGDLPDNCEDCMEAALQQYKVSRFTKGKSSPIQANLLEFPTIKNAVITVFEAEVDYPATSTVVAELIANATGINRDNIRVRTPLEEANFEIETENAASDDDKKKESILAKGYDKENNQSLMGDKQVASFLKTLAKVRKETEQVKGINDALLAKKMHKEKADTMPAAGPARSLFGGSKKD
jgi:hypothetical protein